ncbi:jg132 [Pararge aegeria aegeria]|uniref:Jg132 protein n=1 Tax=Pararge aegeria aegeria TaxID=348720 RepID=A0A8S4QW47_9NEOP|nr:jg132 [Pararge aegeria aegeria]
MSCYLQTRKRDLTLRCDAANNIISVVGLSNSYTNLPPGVQRQAQTALIISSVALAVFLLSLIIICRGRLSWRYIKQKLQPSKNRVKQHPSDLTHYNPHTEMPKPKPELKLEIRNPDPPKRNQQPLNVKDLDARTQTEKSQGATTPKTISTALSNRHPAEDTTLDFSYDNIGLNVTPPQQASGGHRF